MFNDIPIGTRVYLYQKIGNIINEKIMKYYLGSGIICSGILHNKILQVDQPSENWQYGNSTTLTPDRIKLREIKLTVEKEECDA